MLYFIWLFASIMIELKGIMRRRKKKSEMFYLYPNHKAIWKLSCLLLSSQDLIWWFDFWMLVLGEYMFLCAYFNLWLSSLRVFFMKKMMDAISSITGCSFQVPSTENSPDFWGKWHEKWLFSSVREWKSGKGQSSLTPLFLVRCPERCTLAPGGQQHFLCGSGVENAWLFTYN